MRSLGWRPVLAALLIAVGTIDAAASIYFPPVPPDLSRYALQAQIPQPCPAVPLPDTLNGAVGTAAPCTPRTDTARPTVVQAAIVTTDASGNWSVTWAKAFASASPYINPQAINTGTQPMTCNVATSSTTAASGKCWSTVTMTLPSLATSLLGLVLNSTSAAASVQVRVAAREPTQ